MQTIRIVEKKVNGIWNRCKMQSLRSGDIFRMFDTRKSRRVGNSNYIATSNAKLGINRKYPAIYGIEAKPH